VGKEAKDVEFTTEMRDHRATELFGGQYMSTVPLNALDHDDEQKGEITFADETKEVKEDDATAAKGRESSTSDDDESVQSQQVKPFSHKPRNEGPETLTRSSRLSES
jgi:hypothetical protein